MAHTVSPTSRNSRHPEKISLADGSRTPVVAPTPFAPRGVILTGDARFAYVSDDSDKITRFDLLFNTFTVVASGLNALRYLTFADAGESIILFPEPNPAGAVYKLDLTARPRFLGSDLAQLLVGYVAGYDRPAKRAQYHQY